MRRIIGTIGATLAVVAAMATPAAAQDRGGKFGFDLNPTVDAIRVTSAATTNQNLLVNFSERRPGRVIDASVASENLRLNVGEGTLPTVLNVPPRGNLPNAPINDVLLDSDRRRAVSVSHERGTRVFMRAADGLWPWRRMVEEEVEP
jgi:hypothetical protein